MTEREYRKEEFRRIGLRCIEPVTARFLDGSMVTITASGYQSSNEKKWPDATERQKRAWKFYSIVCDNQQATEIIDELELENRMGTDQLD